MNVYLHYLHDRYRVAPFFALFGIHHAPYQGFRTIAIQILLIGDRDQYILYNS